MARRSRQWPLANTVALLCSLQGGSLGVLPGYLANHLQRAGAPPRPDEGEAASAPWVHLG